MEQFKVQKINLKDGRDLTPKKINIFIGANNCGKTQLLKDILSYITKKEAKCIVIDSLKLPEILNWEDIQDKYDFNIAESSDENEMLSCISSTFDSDDHNGFQGRNITDIMNGWLKSNEKAFWKYAGAGFVSFLNTDNRLKLIQSRQSNDLRKFGAKNILEAVYLSDTNSEQCETYEKIRSKIKEIFGTDIYLDSSNPGVLLYRTGEDFSNIPARPQTAYRELDKYPSADEQGDGLRSTLGIVSAISALKKPVILLDEPEAFLHPPQALQLGKSIVDFVDDDKQLFIATHSADFLRGMISLEKNHFDNIEIVHLTRNGNETEFKVLENKILSTIIQDPLLSSSRVLEGMFYRGVAATEGDADAVFYQRAFQKIYPSDEIHFVNAHNKQTLKKLIEPYKNLGIKFAMIADADILRDEFEFKALLDISDDEVIKQQILNNGRTIRNCFQSKSKSELYRYLVESLRRLIPNDTQMTESDAQKKLHDLRKELKKLREESDEFYSFKQSGREAIPDDETRKIFDELCTQCMNIGLFIVPAGELESWLIDYGINRTSNKSKWITDALNELPKINYEPCKKIWKFIDDLYEHFKSK